MKRELTPVIIQQPPRSNAEMMCRTHHLPARAEANAWQAGSRLTTNLRYSAHSNASFGWETHG